MNLSQIATLRSLMSGVAGVTLAEKRFQSKQNRAGLELKKARLGEDITLQQIADKIGVSYSRVWQIEEGANVTPDLFKQFLDAVDTIAGKRRKNVRRYYKTPKPYAARP
jgi:DNA-binding XRE family transcriptional regulator